MKKAAHIFLAFFVFISICVTAVTVLAGDVIVATIPAGATSVTYTNRASLIDIGAIEIANTNAVTDTNTVTIIRHESPSHTSIIVPATANTTQTHLVNTNVGSIYTLRPGDLIKIDRTYTNASAYIFINHK